MWERQFDVPLSVSRGSAASQTHHAKQKQALGEANPKILSISAVSEDHDLLRRILNDPHWRITRAFSCHQAITCLCRDRMALIVCDCHLPDGTWRDILSYIAALNDPPSVIVTALTADANLHSEVRSLGGYDVLAKPFSPEKVKHVLAAAWEDRTILADVAAPV